MKDSLIKLKFTFNQMNLCHLLYTSLVKECWDLNHIIDIKMIEFPNSANSAPQSTTETRFSNCFEYLKCLQTEAESLSITDISKGMLLG